MGKHSLARICYIQVSIVLIKILFVCPCFIIQYLVSMPPIHINKGVSTSIHTNNTKQKVLTGKICDLLKFLSAPAHVTKLE